MAKYQIYKETTLPGTLQPHSIYLVAPAARPDYVEIYVTGVSAATVKRAINQSDIQALIDSAIGTVNSTIFVANIAARNALLPLTKNTIVLVLDATGDATVASGAATYAYKVSESTWTKISEAESMDIVINWAGLSGKPSSAVVDIDDAVSKRHSHSNKTQLDKIGEAGGELTYNSLPVVTAWTSTNW